MQIIRQLFGNDRIHDRLGFRCTEFPFCLSFKLQYGFRDRAGNDRSQAFSDIASFKVLVFFFQKTGLSGEFVDDLGESRLIADLMRAAIACPYQIDIGEGILLIAVRVLESDIHAHSVLFTGERDGIM